MSKKIEVLRIIARAHGGYFEQTDDVGENREKTQKAIIDADAVRCCYPRKDGKPGCRLTFTDGGGFAVANSYEAMRAALAPVSMVGDTQELIAREGAPTLADAPAGSA